ncbi:MAG: preprotein translocase subunit SecG [Nitrospirota bacterium]|nr:preprotein translocase subunit SecG [Nitrospirota bacterium]
MSTLFTIIHVTVCVLMIGIILLQRGKGSDIGASFGGGSHTLFGARGATSFLAKVTVACAAIFMTTSLVLAIMARHGSGSSVISTIGETNNFFEGDVTPAALPDLSAPPAASPENSAPQEKAPKAK